MRFIFLRRASDVGGMSESAAEHNVSQMARLQSNDWEQKRHDGYLNNKLVFAT